jgi:SAM-dependent methyltransferase
MMKKVLYAALKRFGSAQAKQRIWDNEFATGKWSYLDDQGADIPRDIVLDVIDKYSEGRDILDLGCGIGRTGIEIANRYKSYVGVDISTIAVKKASGLVEEDGTRMHKNRYLVADISQFNPGGAFSVILFRESLYYFSFHVIRKILRHYAGFVAPQGVMIVRLHDTEKYKAIINLIEQEYMVVECSIPHTGDGIVLVFSPQHTAPLFAGESH